jgi:hypothetical protein
VTERRAYRLNVAADKVTITIKPNGSCVNPVFELDNAPKHLSHVTLTERPLREDEYAWDGQRLWLSVTVSDQVRLTLEFDPHGHA